MLYAQLKVKMLVAQPYPTFGDPMDCNLPGFSVCGIFQVRILECYPSPGYLPDPGIEPGSTALQADSLPSEPPGKPLAQLKQNISLLHN